MTRARDLADLAGAADAGTVTGANLIINGDMAVSQRATAATTVTNDTYGTVDRFKFFESSDGVYTSEQSTTSPSGEGFSYSLKLAVTTADTSIGATQYAAIAQYIEAQNLQHLRYGTSSAKSLTLSFWVRSSKTGTYTIALEKSDSTLYRYVKEYSISTADTWEKKTITIEPDSQIKASAGAIDNDNGYGIRVFWNLVWGSTYNGATDGAWSSDTNDYATSNQVNWLDSTSNDFYLTGVKLEVGSVATPYPHESYGETLAKCQRYYWQFTANAPLYAFQYHASYKFAIRPHPVEMRATPTMTIAATGATVNSYQFDKYHYKGYVTSGTADTTANFITSLKANAEL